MIHVSYKGSNSGRAKGSPKLAGVGGKGCSAGRWRMVGGGARLALFSNERMNRIVRETLDLSAVRSIPRHTQG